ncbi:MAG TPA: hypothetical protein VFW94_19140 [Candidatus Acidoferrales bacterium]|nr:hypothetical protein [Candidatus Acidoferrales bacterium]
MSFSSDKYGKGASAQAGGATGSARPERRLTVGLARAARFAVMVARSRAAAQVEVADMLAGMYLYEWERLAPFWPDRDAIETLLRRICSVSPQRWNHLIEAYDKQRRAEQAEASSPWRRLMQRTRPTEHEKESDQDHLPYSLELEHVMRSAAEISPFRDDLGELPIPVLTSECVLVCIACNDDSELGPNLRATGLDLPALERAARDPRRVPHR